MDGSIFSSFVPPHSVRGDRYIRSVTLRLQWPLSGSKGNSALRELFLILRGSACVTAGGLGSEGIEDAGDHEQKKSVLW